MGGRKKGLEREREKGWEGGRRGWRERGKRGGREGGGEREKGSKRVKRDMRLYGVRKWHTCKKYQRPM